MSTMTFEGEPAVEPGNRFEDQVARALAHIRRAVDDARHRHRRNTGCARDVEYRGSAAAAAVSLRQYCPLLAPPS